jgi:asparagine synthase (glutamine-hydrolysing)
MCGIAGKIYLGKGEIDKLDLQKMSNAIEHRGPDDEGMYISSNHKLGLVSRRLAVLDLSAKGHQPMVYKKNLVISFNGEIYNFQEEREKLRRLGYKFSSNSDTEVILALYDKYGISFLSHMRGMFALAIYDRNNHTLLLARDRLGKKPLKYFYKNGCFCFASELKSILTQKEVHRKPDWLAVHNFMTYGYVPAPQTGFEDIQKLPPAHYLLLDLGSGELTQERYWKLDFNHKQNYSEGEWCQRILEGIEESVKLRMVSDVPIGAFLSGGVDSSTVVAFMARNSSRPVKTFTIGFKEDKYNESQEAKRIASMYNTDHTELFVEPESVEILPQLVYQYEEPYADSSAVVTYLVSKLARQSVTVVLNGDGGDENFAGYPRYVRLDRDVKWDRYKNDILPWALPLSKSLTTPFNINLFEKAYKFLNKSKLPLASRFVTYNYFFSNEDKFSLYSEKFKSLIGSSDSYEYYINQFEQSEAADPRDRALYSDLTAYLPECLLAKVDIASMKVSLEGRSPLVDHKFVEMVAQIPFDLKVKKGETKYILKKAAEKILPKENIYRPKMGFSIPLSDWFKGDLNKYARGKILNSNLSKLGVFDNEEIKRMISLHGKNNDFGSKLWALLTLNLWFDTFFK